MTWCGAAELLSPVFGEAHAERARAAGRRVAVHAVNGGRGSGRRVHRDEAVALAGARFPVDDDAARQHAAEWREQLAHALVVDVRRQPRHVKLGVLVLRLAVPLKAPPRRRALVLDAHHDRPPIQHLRAFSLINCLI